MDGYRGGIVHLGSNKIEVEKAKKQFHEKYGARLPDRSVLWNPLFGLYAGAYFLVVLLSLRGQGWFRAMATGLRGVLIILLLWGFILGFHAINCYWADSQYPMAYWNTSARFHPNPQLGLAMSIASRPLPLLAYLFMLWPILPGSLDVLMALGRNRSDARRRVYLAMAVAMGAIFVAFHLWMMFAGSFSE